MIGPKAHNIPRPPSTKLTPNTLKYLSPPCVVTFDRVRQNTPGKHEDLQAIIHIGCAFIDMSEDITHKAGPFIPRPFRYMFTWVRVGDLEEKIVNNEGS